MKKGFTLIELIAVLIILAVIGLITMPIVNNSIENSRERALEETIRNIEHAALVYGTENLIGKNTEYKKITLDELKTKGYLENKDIINPTTNEPLTGCILYKWENSQYNFKYSAECSIEDSENDEVVLTGSPIIDKVKELVYGADGKCKTDGSTYQYMGGCYIKAEPSITLANHIWYNGFLWRIMGINSDGSVRMITEENVTAISYNVSGNTDFDGSHADKWLNEYFYGKLSNENNLKTNVIVSVLFCQGEATTSSSSSRTDCTNGTTLTRNVGLISIDEYSLSGGKTSYLKNGQYFWTMSPNSSSNAWYVYAGGNAGNYSVDSMYGLRPVINVNSNTTITSGNGTLNDYYVLGEKKGDTNITGTLTTAKVGEYVMLNDKRYRVVENGSITKLILDGYYQETSETNYTMKYGNNNTFSTTTGIGYKLNTDVLNWLTAGDNQEKLRSMILPSTWYQNNFEYGNSYEVSLNETTPTRSIENVQVGLIRIGEMLSVQSYSILTQNGKVVSSYDNADDYWIMTPYPTSISACYVGNYGHASYNPVSAAYGLRPVINISSTNEIESGNGAPNTPYVITVQ